MNDLKVSTGIRFLALVLAFVMVLGVVPTTAFAAKANSVSFEVKDSNGAVAGAKVTLTCVCKEEKVETITSDTLEDGTATLEYKGKLEDLLSVTYKVEKEGYMPVSGTTALNSTEKVTICKSEVIIKAVDAAGNPVASAVATYKVNGEGEDKTAGPGENGVIVIDLDDTDEKITCTIIAAGCAPVVKEIKNGTTVEVTMPKAEVTFNVKDEQDAAVVGAAVKVSIGDSAIDAVTGEDGSVVVDLSAYTLAVDTVINYTVDKSGTNAAKDGYKTASGTAAAGDVVNLKLEKAKHLVETSVVDADGNGLKNVTVNYTIDGIDVGYNTTNEEGKISTSFEVENPEKLTYKATVCGTEYSDTVACGTEGSTKVNIQADVVTLNVVINGSGTGTVTIDGNKVSNGDVLVVKKDTPIAIAVAPGEKCRNEEPSIPGTDNGDGTYTFAQGGEIKVEFVQTYTVTVAYNAEQGTAEILDGDKTAGTVTVDKGEAGLKLHVVANESKGYEIESISGFDNVEGKAEVELEIPEVKRDVTIEVTFRVKTYEVTLINDSALGEASVSADQVLHGESVTLTVIPAKSYVIDSVVVTGQITGTEKVYTVTHFANNQITVDQITEPINIVVTYAGVNDVGIGDFTVIAVDAEGNDVSDDRLVRHEEGSKLYVFRKDTKVKIYTEAYNVLRLMSFERYGNYEKVKYEAGDTISVDPYDWIQWCPIYVVDDEYAATHADEVVGYPAWSTVTYTNEKGNTNTVKVGDTGWNSYFVGNVGDGHRISVAKWVQEGNNGKWSFSQLNNLRIVFDTMGPTVTLAEENGIVGDKGYKDSTYYTGDVTINVTATEEEYYSGVASIEYFISNVNSTENAEWTAADNMSGDGEKVGAASFTVTAEEHDWENVYVFVRATDKAGNVTTELVETLHINTKAPTVDVKITCEAGHGTYCKCDERIMTVTVTDRADTIIYEDAVVVTWMQNGTQKSKSIDIDRESAVVGENGFVTGTATLVLQEEAAYTDMKISYKGESGEADAANDTFYIDRTLVSNVEIIPGSDENGEKPLNDFYNSTDPISVTVNAVEEGMKTGIKEVKFEVGYYKDGIFEVTESSVVNDDGLNEDGTFADTFTGTFTVDPTKNNRCDVILRVTTLDNAGNDYQQESKIDIDITAPVVEISFDNNTAENEKYFDAARTATIKVTERADHFDTTAVDPENAKITGYELTVTAEDAEGNVLEVPVLGDWEWDKEAVHGAEITYTTTVAFAADANYTFDFAVTDLAGNKSGEVIYAEGTVASNEFAVDTEAPVGNLYADAVIVSLNENGEEVSASIPYGKGWNQLVTPLTFGIWSNDTITVTGIADDTTSNIAKVEYYKHNGNVALTYDENQEVLKDETKAENEQVITAWTPVTLTDIENRHKGYDIGVYSGNEQFTIYLRITDLAGNVSYISTNGMIVDNKEPTGEQPGTGVQTVGEIKIDIPEGNKNGFHTSDIVIGVSVVDPMFSGDAANKENGTFAGLQSVSYVLSTTDTRAITEEIVLFDKDHTNGATYSDTGLCSSWAGTVTVPAADFNSNHVILLIKAVDNAGNVQFTTTADGEIKIDTTAPKIHIKYNNNNPDSGSFYKADRSATITVTERNFDAAAVTAYITKNNDAFAMLDPEKWDPTPDADGSNGDKTTHTQTITFGTDGDYTFHLECTDLADWTSGNVEGKSYNNAVTFEDNTQNPTAFTIDKTLPVINVSYDNNAAQNGNYFNATRTATITIDEHNFDQNRVRIAIGAARGGSEPRISWRTGANSDIHVATVSYTVDGDYTFDINMTDKAGNANSGVNYGRSVAAKDFVVDTTYADMVTISDVDDGAAYGYNQTVIPGVKISDINLDIYEVSLIGVQKDKTIDLSEEAKKLLSGSTTDKSGTLDLFKMVQDMDGIYTLTVTGTDKAGNVDTEVVMFTVNRFGSVYAYGEYLVNLIANGGSFVYSVNEDLIITEYNADKLLADSLVVEITRDGKPLDNVIYEVTPEINDKAQPGTSGWYQYTYTISSENFAADGVYKIAVSSKDATGNKPENINYEDMGITFRVDSTQAEITSVVGLESAIINASGIDVTYTIFDTIGLKSIKVYVDGQMVDEITDFTGDMNNYTGTFHLDESSNAQSVRLVVEDMSGNITDTDAEDFSSAYAFNKSVTVSTNIFVRWYANKALFWGSIVGAIGLAALLWFLLAGKRKKEKVAEA